MKVSIIIPVINEATNLEQLLPFLNSFSGQNLVEIIVADGGSTDNSEKISLENDVIFLKCSAKGRSLQMNEATKISKGEILYFLHADSRPPKEFTNNIIESINNGCEAGCFRMDFDSRHLLLRLSAWFTQFNFTWCRGGDQSLFVTRIVFDAAGGYDEKLIIYEDNEILERIRKHACFCVIKRRIVTSARRFRENGTIRLYLVFMWIHTKYRLGASHEQIQLIIKNMSNNHIKLIHESANFLKSKGISKVDLGIVLGTGLSHFVNEIEIISEIPYNQIPGFSMATVEFHAGKLIYGKVNGKFVLAMNGRYHYYEGYSMQEITLPIRVMKLLGINNLFLSNAAGGMDLSWKKGDLMLITDHINLQNSNPLIGKNLDEFGPRFPDMSKAYDKSFIKIFNNLAKSANIILRNGIYVSVMGSMLESPAEYRFLRKIGADAVGMSTVPEVIVANHMGMNVSAISVITDECDPDNLQPINIAEIIEIAGKSEKKMAIILKEFISTL